MSAGGDETLLLSGATGYIGGRLLPVLEAQGRLIRCLARRPDAVSASVHTTEVVRGDLSDPQTLEQAMQGVTTAYFLVHAMASGSEYEQRDRENARNFAAAARAAGVKEIVYLGGLGSGDQLSPHLASRQEVGRILRESGVPTVEFRASIIIGSGSLSFEMIRALVDRLPVMTTPRWVKTPAQPIAVEDVIAYLSAAASLDLTESRVYEIGGSDQVSYLQIMQEYARQRGLHRIFVPVPVLSPGLSSLWLGLITPIYARVGRQLIEGVRNRTTVNDDSASRDFEIVPRSVAQAIARALVFEDRAYAITRWSDALSSGHSEGFGGTKFGRRLIDSRSLHVRAGTEQSFAPILRIGGRSGWYAMNWTWRARGLLDLAVGGVGVRRGRRSPDSLRVGDALDFWRVERFEPGRLLRLAAEMKVPGRAWLQFEVDAEGSGSRITQTAVFDPAGVVGQLYWYGLWPIHQLVFRGMLRGISRAVGQSMTSATETKRT